MRAGSTLVLPCVLAGAPVLAQAPEVRLPAADLCRGNACLNGNVPAVTE